MGHMKMEERDERDLVILVQHREAIPRHPHGRDTGSSFRLGWLATATGALTRLLRDLNAQSDDEWRGEMQTLYKS